MQAERDSAGVFKQEAGEQRTCEQCQCEVDAAFHGFCWRCP